MNDAFLIKKFYRDFTEAEVNYITDIVDDMASLEIEIPPHVIQRMINRGIMETGLEDATLVVGDDNVITISGTTIVSELVTALEQGIVYEVSNEGLGHSYNPYRVVVAYENEGYTLFLKVAPLRNSNTTKILDVWKRHGTMPTYPPIKALDQFSRDWEFIPEMEDFFRSQSTRESLFA